MISSGSSGVAGESAIGWLVMAFGNVGGGWQRCSVGHGCQSVRL